MAAYLLRGLAGSILPGSHTLQAFTPNTVSIPSRSQLVINMEGRPFDFVSIQNLISGLPDRRVGIDIAGLRLRAKD